MNQSPVLVVGASGFVGRHVCIALKAAGHAVRRASSKRSRFDRSLRSEPWVYLDLDDPDTYVEALRGCSEVIYLYHGLASGRDYPIREARVTSQFYKAMVDSGIHRVAYLGGVAPKGSASRHLQSRMRTGEILRSGPLVAIELRASMIIGRGSASFNAIRDLAVRLPVLGLPPWLDNGSCPIAIDDVVYALTKAVEIDAPHCGCFDLPGPEWLTHRDLLSRLSSLLGTRVLERRLGWLSPALSARLLGIIGRERYPVIAELIQGLPADLTPSGVNFWTHIGQYPRRSLMNAMLDALADETCARQPSDATVERINALFR